MGYLRKKLRTKISLMLLFLLKRDPASEAVEDPVMADVIPVEEEESTMGTHEIDKHVCCLVIKPDAMEKVTFT